MKRVCTESERELLFQNSEQMLSGKKKAKDFLNQNNLMINGATIIEVDVVAGRFAYIEDDFFDEKGNPIIISPPSCPNDMTSNDVGKRILVLYDSNSNFQLIRLNEELKGLIPDSSYDVPGEEKLSECICVPHPNIVKIKKEGHELSEREREEFAELHVKVRRSSTSKILKFSSVFLAIIAIILCVLLDIVEGGYPFSQTVPIAIAGYAGIMLFCLIMYPIGNVNLRRTGQFVYMKEVVFHSFSPEENVFTIYVYEWIDGKVQICEYPDCDIWSGTAYGNILYKFTKPNGEIYIQNTNQICTKK